MQNHPQSKEKEFTYNEEFVNFMVKILREGKDYDFSEYDKLEKVLEYISKDVGSLTVKNIRFLMTYIVMSF